MFYNISMLQWDFTAIYAWGAFSSTLTHIQVILTIQLVKEIYMGPTNVFSKENTF
jgi:hypothetical protein